MTVGAQPVLSHRRKRAVLSILVAALLLTAPVLLLVVPRLDQAVDARYSIGFADGYDLIANNIAHGRGYRFEPDMGETMMREPGYPMFLAGVFKIAGYRIEAARWANWLLVVAIAFLIMRLAQSVTSDLTTSLIATLLFLFHPGAIISEARAGVETLFIFAVLLFILALHEAVARGTRWHYLVAGLALGLVVQVRSTPIVFPFFLLLYLLLTANGRTERLKSVVNVAVVVLGMILVMAPWMIRNFVLVHHLIPSATVQGVAAQEGQYTCQNMSFGENFYVVQRQAGRLRAEIARRLGLRFEGEYYYQFFYDPKDEWSFNNILLRRAEEGYTNQPLLLATCVCKNAFNLWFLGKTPHTTWLNVLVQVPFLGFAVGGLYLLWRRGLLKKMGIMLMFVLCVLAVQLPIIAHARHSVPIVPFLSIPASISLMSIWRRCRAHIQRETT
jgi:4-amino-4-deoxy-L-arabinose transferase-like glycosyltransferase